MNITITLTASPELLSVLQAFSKMQVATPAINGTVKKSSANGVKTTPVEVNSQETAPVDTVTETVGENITIEMIRPIVQEKNQAGKREQIKALLAEFGADKVTNLAKEHFSGFLQKIKAL
jgi:hypothetical protein